VPRLLVIIADRLSSLVAKGETTPGYYNPGGVFDHLDVLMINDDAPDVEAVRPMVGHAGLGLHTLPPPSFVWTAGWSPRLLRGWARRAVGLARTLRPDVVRCYANWLNAYAGVEIGSALGIPVVISVHVNADVDLRGRTSVVRLREWLLWRASRAVEAYAMPRADVVLPVYEPAAQYARTMGARRVEVVYNAVDAARLLPKASYELSRPPRVVSVGRQFGAKYPANVIRACARLGARLTLVGSGPAHGELRKLAAEVGADAEFIPAMANERLAGALRSYDVFATHSEYWEISKAVLEALHVGLPVVLNRRIGEPVPELQGEHCLLVEDTADAYAHALAELFSSQALRARLGIAGRRAARERFDPAMMQARVVQIYESMLTGPVRREARA
jgi:glycosyltransferase involved in cell wall biosynthesis